MHHESIQVVGSPVPNLVSPDNQFRWSQCSQVARSRLKCSLSSCKNVSSPGPVQNSANGLNSWAVQATRTNHEDVTPDDTISGVIKDKIPCKSGSFGVVKIDQVISMRWCQIIETEVPSKIITNINQPHRPDQLPLIPSGRLRASLTVYMHDSVYDYGKVRVTEKMASWIYSIASNSFPMQSIICHDHRISTSYHSDLPTYFHLEINIIFLSFLFVFVGDKWEDLLLSTVISLVFHMYSICHEWNVLLQLTPLIINQDSVSECTIVVTVGLQ